MTTELPAGHTVRLPFSRFFDRCLGCEKCQTEEQQTARYQAMLVREQAKTDRHRQALQVAQDAAFGEYGAAHVAVLTHL